MQARRLALSEQRGTHDLGVRLVDQPVDHLMGGRTNTLVEVRKLDGQAFALGDGVVAVGAGEGGEAVVQHHLDVRWGEDALLDGVEHDGVQPFHADGDARAARLYVASRAAEVQVGPLAADGALGDTHAAPARPTTQPGGQDPMLPRRQGAQAVAAPALASFALQRALRADARERLLIDGGLVRVPRDDGPLVDDVAAVHRVPKDVVDMPRPPRSRGDLPGVAGVD